MNAAPVKLLELRPTQFALEMVQVRSKMAQTRRIPADQRDRFMDTLAIVVVRGPGDRLHVIDHHHWSRAWIELGIEKAPVRIKADFGGLDDSGFLRTMIDHGWIHPYNERGEKVPIESLPTTVVAARASRP